MSATLKYVFLGVSCLLAGLAIGFNLSQGDARTTDIRWKYGDAELVIDLEKDVASDETMLGKIFSHDFSAAGARDWLRKYQNLFEPTDPDLSDQLAELSYDDPAAHRLRGLRTGRRGPWAYRLQEIRIGIPDYQDQPRIGHANVCESGIFHRQRIEIFLPDHPERKITVQASGRYACPEGYDFPDIQLNAKDAEQLFGYRDFNKYEPAAAIVITE